MGAHLSRTVAEGLAFMQIVDGKPVDSLSGKRIDVASPSDGRCLPPSRPRAKPMSTAP
jgi:aldehyde dehydrogenase (NAD+)